MCKEMMDQEQNEQETGPDTAIRQIQLMIPLDIPCSLI